MFEHSFTVAEADIDALGHANNVAFVRWIQDAAVAHSVSVGLDWEAYRRMGSIFVVRRHEVDYLRPALLGERLIARTSVTESTGAKSFRSTEIVRAGEKEPLVRAVTTWVLIDIASGRPMRIPPELIDRFPRAA